MKPMKSINPANNRYGEFLNWSHSQHRCILGLRLKRFFNSKISVSYTVTACLDDKTCSGLGLNTFQTGKPQSLCVLVIAHASFFNKRSLNVNDFAYGRNGYQNAQIMSTNCLVVCTHQTHHVLLQAPPSPFVSPPLFRFPWLRRPSLGVPRRPVYCRHLHLLF